MKLCRECKKELMNFFNELKKKRMKFICENGVKHTDTPVVFWKDIQELEEIIKNL